MPLIWRPASRGGRENGLHRGASPHTGAEGYRATKRGAGPRATGMGKGRKKKKNRKVDKEGEGRQAGAEEGKRAGPEGRGTQESPTDPPRPGRVNPLTAGGEANTRAGSTPGGGVRTPEAGRRRTQPRGTEVDCLACGWPH